MLQLSVPGVPEPRPVGYWSFWDAVKSPVQSRGWMSSAREANTTKGGLVLLGGSAGLAGGAPPAHGKVWISNIPAPRWHCTLPTDTRTLLQVPRHSPAHGSPRSWTPVWLCQVTQRDVTRARDGTCLREAIQMGRPLDLASHLPETAWHGGLGPGMLSGCDGSRAAWPDRQSPAGAMRQLGTGVISSFDSRSSLGAGTPRCCAPCN